MTTRKLRKTAEEHAADRVAAAIESHLEARDEFDPPKFDAQSNTATEIVSRVAESRRIAAVILPGRDWK